jgi:hypothetical protein
MGLPSKSPVYGLIGFSVGGVVLVEFLLGGPVDPDFRAIIYSIAFGLGFVGMAFAYRHPVWGLIGFIGIVVTGSRLVSALCVTTAPIRDQLSLFINACICFVAIATLMQPRLHSIPVGLFVSVFGFCVCQVITKVSDILIPMGWQRNLWNTSLTEVVLFTAFGPVMGAMVYIMRSLLCRVTQRRQSSGATSGTGAGVET